jgi:hypothetical protein
MSKSISQKTFPGEIFAQKKNASRFDRLAWEDR